MLKFKLLDCTLRDGGYYNFWDFNKELIDKYLIAMKSAQVDVVELGFRFHKNEGFKGACAYTSDEFLARLTIPSGLMISVMINAADLCGNHGWEAAIEQLFPHHASESAVELVRLACHVSELPQSLPATAWLSERGYKVGINIMQIAERTQEEIHELTRKLIECPLEVLYFADSMGSMTPEDTARIVGWIRKYWEGPLGIHTHDNMGLALANTLRAQAEGVSWLDSTVTGMGRGPGNARTEELVIEAEAMRHRRANLVPLMELIRQYFGPMKASNGWGSNPYYYLAGKYGIHPSYIQEMMGDVRYEDEDILAVINHLRGEGGKKFNYNVLQSARDFYSDTPRGTWNPTNEMAGHEVLILGTGPGVAAHRLALEAYIRRAGPLVIALNTQAAIDSSLIDLRIACHPVRLLADADAHIKLPQPLITPTSMLSKRLKDALGSKVTLDFGLGISPGRFEVFETYCILPTSLVLAYALAVVSSGKAKSILMAGFDGYPSGDLRNDETAQVFQAFAASGSKVSLTSITPTVHAIPAMSVYAI